MQASVEPPASGTRSVLCVLPARLGSARLPRKPLRTIAGRPLVEWTWRALDHDIVVNFQAAEPFADPGTIGRAVDAVGGAEAPLASVAAPVGCEAEWRPEEIEKLEQLRALEASLATRVVVGPATEPGVDEPRDLERAGRLLERARNGERHV